jgi:hypothetical protein
VTNLRVISGGSGYSPTTNVKACPAGSEYSAICNGCRFVGDLTTLQNSFPKLALMERNQATGCFSALEMARLEPLIGQAGGTPGSFDDCFETVMDPGSCTCGSALAPNVTNPGIGYTDGVLIAIETGKWTGECVCPVNKTGTNCTQELPSYCFPSGYDFNATFSVRSDGSIESVNVTNPGASYNSSYLSFYIAYENYTQCDASQTVPGLPGVPGSGTAGPVGSGILAVPAGAVRKYCLQQG